MYYIIETQQNADDATAILTYTEADRNKAISKWHEILRYAAISSVYIHSCAVLDESLRTVARESYIHLTNPSTE